MLVDHPVAKKYDYETALNHLHNAIVKKKVNIWVALIKTKTHDGSHFHLQH